MDELAKLIVQGVALIICFVAFTKVKGTFLNVIMGLNVIICIIFFYGNYYSNFAGV